MKYRKFLAESHLQPSNIVKSFDVVAAEQYFAGKENLPDCIPTNIRGWHKIKAQLDRLAEAHVKFMPLIKNYKATMRDVNQFIYGADNTNNKFDNRDNEDFKGSIFEIYQDVMRYQYGTDGEDISGDRQRAAQQLSKFGFNLDDYWKLQNARYKF